MSPADVLVLSGATPGFDPDGLAEANHRRFAASAGHRQRFMTAGFDPDRPASWSKLRFIQEALDPPPPNSPAWVFWLDADAVFLRAGDLRELCDPAYDLIVGADANGITLGAMLVRNSYQAVLTLDRAWWMGDDWRWRWHGWWEQAAVRHLIETEPEVAARVKVVPHRLLHSYPHVEGGYADGDLVAHFCGLPHDRKAAGVREWAGRL